MRAASPGWALLVALFACRSTSGDGDAVGDAAVPEVRSQALPESLRCRRAADCVQKPSCYWETPACVAASSVSEEKCGEDADPSSKDYPPVVCDCFEGQCVPK